MRSIEQRLADNFDAVLGEILAPRRSLLERALIRLGIPEPWARQAAATKVLRWSWAIAVLLVLVIVAGAAGSGWTGADQLAPMLAVAPLAPVLAVAAVYGPLADRSYPVLLVAPRGGLGLLLIRTLTVLAGTTVTTLIAALLGPPGGWLRVAWLVPAVAVTGATVALGGWLGVRRAATTVSVAWLAVVLVAGQVGGRATAAFGLAGQLTAAAAALLAGAVIAARRSAYARWLPS